MANHYVGSVLSRGADAAPFLRASDGSVMLYADMRRRVAEMAGALVATGVQPGDRVAARVEKSVEALLLYIATLYVGGVFLPLNTAYTAAEMAYFLEDAEPKLVVCDPSTVSSLEVLALGRLETLDSDGRGTLAEKAATSAPLSKPVERTPEDLAAILYTSGTTGRAKGAMLTHANLVSNAQALADTWRFTADDRLLHALPIYHSHGLFVAVNTTLVAGASLIFQQRFEVGAVIDALPRATVFMGVPTYYVRLLEGPDFTRETARDMRLFTSGSAPLLEAVHRRFAERPDHAILERYGMTETNMITSNPYEGERRAGTVGFPLPGVSVRIVAADTGAVLSVGETGAIETKGPHVCTGYWRNPEKSAASFRPDGFFMTGDLGAIDRDGYLRISGRDKDLIISGGLNVYPKEVELMIDALPGVMESAVIGLPHADLGEEVTAVVVPDANSELDEAAVIDALQGKLARFKQPKRVLFVDELPRNTMGKVQKLALRSRFATGHKAV